MAWDLPLTEFDADSPALINPRPVSTSVEIPQHAVICVFRDVIDEVCGDGRAEVVSTFTWESGNHQLFSLQVDDRRVAVFHPGVGAPQAVLCAVLDERDVPYAVGKTWTTDAPYRETRAKVAARRAEGCITVEMETAAFLAVARFRGVTFGQYLYAGDDVSGETWDHRHWQTSSARRDLFWLSVEAVLRLP
jgi:hypothetical protein